MMHPDAPDGWKPVDIGGFIGLIGPLLRSTRPDSKDVYALQTTDAHKNHVGLVHGGVLATLLDQVIALSAWNAANRLPVVTVQMDTRFLAAARAGDFLETRAVVRHATRSLVFVDAEITDAGRTIAGATAVMKISPNPGTPK